MRVLFAMLMALASPLAALSAEWHGTVVGIADGDTLTLLDANKTHTGFDSTASMHPSVRSLMANVRVSRSPHLRTAERQAPIARRSIATGARYVVSSLTAST